MLLAHTITLYFEQEWVLPRGSGVEDSASVLPVSSAREPSR